MESVEQCSSKSNDQDVPKRRSLEFSDIPLEILPNIIGNLTFENISNIRLVSRDFNHACTYALNVEYIRVKKESLKKHDYLKSQVEVIEDPVLREKHPLFKEYKTVETVYTRLKVLNIKMGRHLERKELNFYGGKVLDEANLILSGQKKNHPNPTEDMLKLCAMLEEHFDGQIKPLLPVAHILERWDISMCMLLTDAKHYDSDCVRQSDINHEDLFHIQTYVFKKPDEIFTQIT